MVTVGGQSKTQLSVRLKGNQEANRADPRVKDPLFTFPAMRHAAFSAGFVAELALPMAIYQYYGAARLMQSAGALLITGAAYYRSCTPDILYFLLAPVFIVLGIFVLFDVALDICLGDDS